MEIFAPKLTYGCNFVFQEAINEVAFGEGYAQRQPDGINSKRLQAVLTFANIRSKTAAAILEFLKARGGAEVFLFTPPAPHDEQYGWVVKQPLSHTISAFDDESIDVTLIQDFSTPVRVAKPVLEVTGGDLSMATATPGADIYWTYNATEIPPRPTIADTIYAAPIVGAPNGFYRARAFKTALLNSFTTDLELDE